MHHFLVAHWCRSRILGLLAMVRRGARQLPERSLLVTFSSSFLLLLLQAKQSLATLTKDVPKRHSLAMPGETVLNGNQEWVVQADLPLTAAIRQSQQTLYHSHPPHPADRQGESCPAWASNKGESQEEATGCSGKGSFFVHTTAAWGSTGQTMMTSLTEPT